MMTRNVIGLAAAGLLALVGGVSGCEKKEVPANPAAGQSVPAPSADTKPVAPAAAVPAGAPAGASGAMAPAGEKKSIVIGVVAKSQNNPVFIAARTGAEDAGRELSKKYGINIEVRWETPVAEDAQKQAQTIEQLVSLGVDGIAVSCSDGEVLRKPIDAAVDAGVYIATFDSDSPSSKRFAYYGINDEECGREVMRQLAKSMDNKGGPIAILSGNQTAPNLNARIKGVREELEKLKDKGFTLKNVYFTKENANDAANMVQSVQSSNPDIAGWAMVGGWPLFTDNALDGVADKAKITSVDTLPAQLVYVKKGQVAALIGQDCYGWGYQSVVYLVEKIKDGKSPAQVVNNFPLTIVTQGNVAEVEGLWQKWLGKK